MGRPPPTAATCPPNTSTSTPTTQLDKGSRNEDRSAGRKMSVERLEAVKKAGVLVEALPFIRRFHGDTIVVKLGGSSMEDAKANILEDIVLLRYVGINPVVVHGGGPDITAWQEKLGIESRFIDGLRITDEKSIEVVKMVLTGKINPELVSALNGLGGQAVGMSGEDGPGILVKPVVGIEGVDRGLVGGVAQVNPEPITALLERNYIPVIASLGLGYDGKSYNVNADTVAAELAVALGARKLILLTDVEGINDKSDQLISRIRPPGRSDKIDHGPATGSR